MFVPLGSMLVRWDQPLAAVVLQVSTLQRDRLRVVIVLLGSILLQWDHLLAVFVLQVSTLQLDRRRVLIV